MREKEDEKEPEEQNEKEREICAMERDCQCLLTSISKVMQKSC